MYHERTWQHAYLSWYFVLWLKCHIFDIIYPRIQLLFLTVLLLPLFHLHMNRCKLHDVLFASEQHMRRSEIMAYRWNQQTSPRSHPCTFLIRQNHPLSNIAVPQTRRHPLDGTRGWGKAKLPTAPQIPGCTGSCLGSGCPSASCKADGTRLQSTGAQLSKNQHAIPSFYLCHLAPCPLVFTTAHISAPCVFFSTDV